MQSDLPVFMSVRFTELQGCNFQNMPKLIGLLTLPAYNSVWGLGFPEQFLVHATDFF